jgi:hypothetical protein
MAQLLFYEKAVPVSPQRHGDLSIEGVDYKFASSVNSVPLTAVEIPAAAREYTIVFAGTEEAVGPVVILGVEGDKNLYIKEDGTWGADYIPAFVRRYPFVFARSEDGKTFTLCVDEDWAGCNKEGRGERLFNEAGERTERLEKILSFLQDYQTQFARTQAVCKMLRDLDLLQSVQADFNLPDGTRKSLRGFMVVNRQKLKELPGEKLAELAKNDVLELIYDHLLSMNNLQQVSKRVHPAAPAAAKEPADSKE